MWWFVGSALAGRPTDAIGAVDSAEGHVRCHYATATDEDLCRDVAAWAEEAWAVEIGALGFARPLPDAGRGGSDALDVYLTRSAGGAGSAWVDCDGGDPDCFDPDLTDDRAAAPAYVVIDPRTPTVDFRHYVHHELCHAPQYASDFTEPYLTLWEATAVACERWVDPSWTTIPSDFGDFQATPWLSTLLQDGYDLADLGGSDDSWYEYGAVAWVFWLDETYGDGAGSIGPALWAAASAPGADLWDAWQVVTGDARGALLDFTAARARMGRPDGPAFAAFAGPYGLARREPTPIDAPAAPADAPFPFGVVYYDAAGPLEVEFDGDDDVEWAVLVIDAEGASDLGGSGSVPTAGPVTIAVVNLGPPGFDPDPAVPLVPSTFRLRLAPADEDRPTSGACTCASGGGGGGGALAGLVALGAVVRRRRQPACSPSPR